ncbi:hypothetical protein B0T18DRAFT_89592 [Schizothecium vesticola]|uniref:NACHT domain-containing protein n=1 Tax=Schizothecium vesticola TaxID=314040 RepID=A0AA40KB98_9PEZI|nr:hypothetical protein B0T18DRAFT_89592 [Schizothecium vesticola]
MAAPPVSDSAQASLTIVEAVESFKRTATPEHSCEIEKTTVKDVVDAIGVIQQDLLKRRSNRNLGKIHPFIHALGHYGGALDVLSNGLSPYMPWIWAPIKLVLQMASDYLGAFDKLLNAYGRIAATLPRIKELGEAFKDSPALLPKLAAYYADILAFHHSAYKFVTRKCWRLFFPAAWATFDIRFGSILTSMAHNSDSIHNEAVAIDLIQSKKWRDDSFAHVSFQEQERLSKQYDSVLAWLNTDRLSHEDHRERLLHDCLPGSCDWVKDHAKVKHWLDIDSRTPVLWVHGKPGAGKTVISASLVEHVQELGTGMTTVYYFCSHLQADTSSRILKSFVLQLINTNPDMAAVIHTDYVQIHREPSVKVLKLMLSGTTDKPGLLSGVSPCRIIIDGIDECEPQEQKPILQDLLQLVSVSAPSNNCKLLVCSRDLPEISRALKNKAKSGGTVPLSEEKDSINQTMQSLARSRLSELASERETWQLTDELVSELCKLIVEKADGMMLWVKLVLDALSDVDTLRELYDAITSMPRELSKLYKRILTAICGEKGHNMADRSDRTIQILGWLIYAKRPLKKHEILNAVALTVGSESPVPSRWDMPDDSAINRCKPLVELLPNGNICLIHFTAEEYLREHIRFDPSSGQPFNRSMAFACSLVLQRGLNLLDPGISQETQLDMVLDGSLALLPYAVDFWLEHLLIDKTAKPISTDDTIGIALTKLEQRHRNLWSKIKHGVEWTGEVHSGFAPQRDPRLLAVSSTLILPLCSALIAFRAKRRMSMMNATDGKEFEKLLVEEDPTLFTTLSTTFHSYVALLLEGAHTHNIPTAKLARFVKEYSQCSHPCRFFPCTSFFVGFSSKELRTAHEKQHVSRLFCVRTGCAIGRLGFGNQRDLVAHNQRYHEEGGILVPPRVRKVMLPASNTPRFKSHSTLLPNLGKVEDMNIVDRSKANELSLSFDIETTKVRDYVRSLGDESTPGMSVVFNQDVNRVLDFDLLLTVSFQSTALCMDFSPDGSLVAVGFNKLVAIFEVSSGQTLYRLDIPGEGDNLVRGVFFHPSPYRNTLALAVKDTLLRVWDYAANTTKVGSGHKNSLSAVSYAPNGEFIATVSHDRTLRLWREVLVAGNVTAVCERLKCTHGSGMACVTVSRNSEYVIAADFETSCLIYSAKNGNLVSRLAHASGSIYDVATSLNGDLLAAASRDRSMLLYNIRPLKSESLDSPIELDEPMALRYHECSMLYIWC